MSDSISMKELDKLEAQLGRGFRLFACSRAKGIDPASRIYQSAEGMKQTIEEWAKQGGKPVPKVEINVTASPVLEVPRENWPGPAIAALGLCKVEALALRLIGKTVSDKGVGDTVARHLELVRAKDMAHAYMLITGQECGCENRQAKLNKKYPYSPDDF